MGDIDPETQEWLSTIKLANLTYISDFENGYNLGVAFERQNLGKGKKFKNSKDMACKFENYKNVRDLLRDNFQVDFPIQNILFSTEQLLITIRDCSKRFSQQKKQATFKKIEKMSQTKVQPSEEKMFAKREKQIMTANLMSQTIKMPKKIEQIEKKLEKYKQIKTKHQLFALEDRKRQLDSDRRAIEDHRLFEINKLRTNHEFMKQHERKVHDVWFKTEQVKKDRIEKDNELKAFMQSKKDKHLNTLKEQEIKSLSDGLQAFQLNCIRQGIELEHDPDKERKEVQDGFNQQVVLERIKDNIHQHEKEKKERIKRENKKNVDAKEATQKSQALWAQSNLIQDYSKKMSQHLTSCSQIQKQKMNEKAQKITIAKQFTKKNYKQLPSSINQQARQEEYAKRKIVYLEEHLQRLETRQRHHQAIGSNVLDALIHIVINHEDYYQSQKGFSFGEWKKVESQFLNYESKNQIRGVQANEFYQNYQPKALEYINFKNQWKVQQISTFSADLQLSSVIGSLITKSYPMLEPQIKENIPLYMPLKMGFVGDHLSGKTSLSQNVANHYGLVVINPKQIIGEAIELNKEPVAEDPKKKKDPKKVQQESPEKIALKQWGSELIKKKIQSPEQATIQDWISAIKFKLLRNFENKNENEIIEQFEKAKETQTQRYNKALKDFEQAQKKGKKDSKKGPQNDEPPTEKKYFYSKGFVIDGIDMSVDNVRIIEKQLNGFIAFEEKINQFAEDLKEKYRRIIFLPQTKKDQSLQKGFFDIFTQLQTGQEVLQQRNNGQKVDTTDRSELQQYYSCFGNENIKMQALWKLSSNGAIEETMESLHKKIQQCLDEKYQSIKKIQSKVKQQQKVEGPVQQKEEIKQEEVAKEEKNEEPQKIQQNKDKGKNTGDNLEEKIPQEAEDKKQNHQDIFNQIIRLPQQKCKKILNCFSDITDKYTHNLNQQFFSFDIHRGNFEGGLLEIQENFLSIINRRDDKAGKILSFQQNYNKLLSEQSNIVKDKQASRHLIAKLDELYNSLWVELESKKNDAVAERKRVKESNWISQEIEKVVEVAKNIMQSQLTMLTNIVFFIYKLNNSLIDEDTDLTDEHLVLGIPPEEQPIESFEENSFQSPRLEYYIQHTLMCLDDMDRWIQKLQKKLKINKLPSIKQLIFQFIEKQSQKLKIRLNLLRDKIKQIYLQGYCFFKALVNKMDDWIIVGIKYQNQFVYEIYKAVKLNIQTAKKSNIRDLFVKEISNQLKPISRLPKNRYPILTCTEANKFKILSFSIFLEELKCLTNGGGKISFKHFRAYFDKRKRSKLLQDEFLSLDYDTMQQYLVTDDFFQFKELCLSMLFWNMTIFDDESLNKYEDALSGKKISTEEGENYSNVRQSVEFEDFILWDNTFDYQQTRILKVFLFEIFKEEFEDKIYIKSYIDTLRLFIQLQVYKYGDCIMMLHEEKLIQHQHK